MSFLSRLFGDPTPPPPQRQQLPPAAMAKAVGESLALLCLQHAFLSEHVPPAILADQRNKGWWSVSLATVYLAFAKYWLANTTPSRDVWVATTRAMDDHFFNKIDACRAEVAVSSVIVTPEERAAYIARAGSNAGDFPRETSDAYTILNLLYADRCNQYSEDLRRGVIAARAAHPRVFELGFFAYKRFNQHLYGFEGDVYSDDLPSDMPHFCPLCTRMFFDAITATMQRCDECRNSLPLSM